MGPNLYNLVLAHHRDGVPFDQALEILVIDNRHITRNVGDLQLGAHSQGSRLETPVNLNAVSGHGLRRPRADPPLKSNVGRHRTHGLAAAVNNAVYTHRLCLGKGLTIGVHGHEGPSRRIEGVNPQVGCTARMGTSADELDLLGYSPVIGAAHAESTLFSTAGGVHHHGQVHVVKLTQLD